jgi:hypothetical protein
VADQVREHLKQHLPDEGIPGEQKNDRLFDAWQEYGCIIPNPMSQQAIWYVKVHGEDASGAPTYSHSLTMLRFALNKLWDDPASYPAPMAGRIEVMASRKPAAATGDAPAAASVGQPKAREAAPGELPKSGADQEPQAAAGAGSKAASAPEAKPAASGVRAPTFRSPGKSAVEAAAKKGALTPGVPKPLESRSAPGEYGHRSRCRQGPNRSSSAMGRRRSPSGTLNKRPLWESLFSTKIRDRASVPCPAARPEVPHAAAACRS